MNIIFLDIDGVLNNPGCYAKRSGSNALPDPKCVLALNTITDSVPDAGIVISSSWRIGRSTMELRELLLEWGVTGRVISRTDHLDTIRGEEIARWIETFKGTRYEVRHFVILDDDRDMGDLMPHLIHVDGSVGLTEDDARAAIDHLSSVAEGSLRSVGQNA